jgi:hypothetical protein
MSIPLNLLAASDSFWAWLLGLDKIDPSAQNIDLEWQQNVPAWGWLLIVLFLAGAAVLSYRHMLGRRRVRSALVVVRTLTLLVIAILLAQPVLVLPRDKDEESRVLILLDRSESMTFADLNEKGDGPGTVLSRHDQLKRLLESNGELWKTLAQTHTLQWYGFGDDVQKLAGPTATDIPKDGQATLMRSAIAESLKYATGRRIGAVLIFSDGRSSEPLDMSIMRRLRQDTEAVFVIPLGSKKAPRDMLLRSPDAPRRVFVKDVVSIRIAVDRVGGGDGPPPTGTKVRLIDTNSGEVLDEKPVDSFGKPVQLRTVPKAAGRARWRIELVSNEPDLIEHNNVRNIDVDLVDRPIRILYIEDRPRWEYRYLKNLMIREKSITSSIMLISADRTFAQEGDVALRRLPQDENELRPYDVIVIGDVKSNFFSAEQLSLFYRQVNEEGAGLVWMAGPRYTPSTYVPTQLSSLLPMRGAGGLTTLAAPIDVVPTAIAKQLNVLRLRSGPDDLSEDPWPPGLPSWQWAQHLKDLKPAAQPLAQDATTKAPLVVRMPFGAGMSLYLASDEVWRWRYGRGELYPEQFWIQLFRMLARNRLRTGADSRARLDISQRESTVGTPVVVDLVLQDQTLLENPPEAVDVKVVDVDRPQVPSQRITLRPAGRSGQYRADWIPKISGRLRLTIASPQLAHLGLERTIDVVRVDSEMRYPATDHPAMVALAQNTNGSVLSVDELHTIPKRIPKPNIKDDSIREPLWHSPLAFVILLVLLGVEWISRRLLGLA